MTAFDDYLNSDSKLLERALTDASYRNYVSNPNLETNDDLATLGDAILRFALSEIIFDEGEQHASVVRQLFENNRRLVTVIAKHYSLLDLMRFDRNDEHKQAGYEWDQFDSRSSGNNRKNNPQKYIADAMEAVLAAFYLDNGRNMDVTKFVVRYWTLLA